MKNLRTFVAIIVAAALIATFCYAGQAKAIELPEVNLTDPNLFIPKHQTWYVEIETIEEATITAYSKAETCPDRPCINAFGRTPDAGYSIACPRRIKLGTRVVFGSRRSVCDDRTAIRFDGRFDIHVDSYKEALAFGKQKADVTIHYETPIKRVY